jgi:two-component system, sensor histidine kinase LadS
MGLAAGLLLVLSGLAWAAPPLVEVGQGAGRMDLQPLVELMTGGEAGLTPEQAKDHPGFAPNTRGDNSRGFTTVPLWVRFQLRAASGVPQLILLEIAYPLLDQVSLTLFYPDGRRQTFEAGDDHEFAVRPLHFANPTFPVDLPAEGLVTGVLRLQTTGSLQFPLILRPASAQSGYISARYLSFGVYYGVFLSLAFLACGIFVYARDASFLLYALYLVSYAVLQFSLNGFGHQFLWSGPGPLASRIPIVLIGTTMLCMMWLTIRFLGFWPHSRALRLAFRVFLVLAASVGVLGAFAPLAVAIPLASVVGSCLLPLILAAGVFSMRRGSRTARYFVVAWGLFLCGVSVSGLTTAGVLPSGLFTTYAMQFGSVLEVWVLALALLDRVRSLREQKEAAVASANRYLRQLTEDLERRVIDRTRALQDSNARLADLARRDSLTGLLNHRASIDRLDVLLAPGEGPVAVIMLDMDHFKQINDRLGHLAGDRVLVAVAELLSRHMRPDDLCGRYGGEEFLIGLKGVDEAAARDRAEMMHQAIRHLSPKGVPERTLSASLGVAVAVPGSSDTAEMVISRADDALYRAKALGRNQVVMAAESEAAAIEGMNLADGRA